MKPPCSTFTIELPEKYRIYEYVSLSLNGHDLGVRSFSPYIWRGKTGLLKNGGNRLNLSIANTLGTFGSSAVCRVKIA